MILIHNIILLLFFSVTSTWAHSLVDFETNDVIEDDNDLKALDNNDVNVPVSQNNQGDEENVLVQVFYESMSPDSVEFYTKILKDIIENMAAYVDINTYPFGNTKVIEKDDNLEFECEQGSAECYGNKLHACAIQYIQYPSVVMYNACLMEGSHLGSDDESADRCGKSMYIDSEPIKACAKGFRGAELLLRYGEISKREHFSHVPHILVNGNVTLPVNVRKYICEAFTNPPPSCKQHLM